MAEEKEIEKKHLNALELYVGGLKIKEVAEEMGENAESLSRIMSLFKKIGMISGGYRPQDKWRPKILNNDLLEEAKRTGKIRLPDSKGLLPSGRKKIIRKKPFPQDSQVDENASEKPEKETTTSQQIAGIPSEEIEVLRRLAQRELAMARSVKRAGTRQMASFRLDSGLLGALKKWAKGEGLTDTEAMNRAIEALLGRADAKNIQGNLM